MSSGQHTEPTSTGGSIHLADDEELADIFHITLEEFRARKEAAQRDKEKKEEWMKLEEIRASWDKEKKTEADPIPKKKEEKTEPSFVPSRNWQQFEEKTEPDYKVDFETVEKAMLFFQGMYTWLDGRAIDDIWGSEMIAVHMPHKWNEFRIGEHRRDILGFFSSLDTANKKRVVTWYNKMVKRPKWEEYAFGDK